MMAASLSRGTAETVARIIWLSVASPRQAVRELLSVADGRRVCWVIVTLSVVIAAISTGIGDWFSLRDQSDASQFTFFSPGQAVAEAGAWTLFELVFGALSYPLTALLWMYVFGFRDKAWLVWGAVATTFGLSIVMDPMLEIASYHATRPDAMIAEWMVWTVYLIIALGLSSYYFVEALSIGPLKALLINSAVFAMILVGVVIAAVLLSLFFGIVILSGTEVPS